MAFSFRSLSKQNLAYQVINPENPNGPINPIYRQYTSPTAQTRTALITDRKIYRPGQTVYYKGISWSTSPDTLYALENRKYKISFKDANDKEIAQQEVTSSLSAVLQMQFLHIQPIWFLHRKFRHSSPHP